MNVPMADLTVQYLSIKPEIDLAIADVINNSSFVMSNHVSDFESDFAKFCDTKFCVGVSDGTSAISLALQAGGIKQGDEVITVPNTFISTTEAISRVGAKIKFVDIDEKTYLIDINKLESAITGSTRAVIAVHLNGLMCDMERISSIAKKHNLIVIEDSAQAHGASINGKKPGFFSDVATFSFYPGKNLGAFGDAGAIVTNDEVIAKKILMLRNHGRALGEKYKYEVEGFNDRLDSIQAAVLKTKLKHLDEWNNKRIKIAGLYNKLLNGVGLPFVPNGYVHVYHQFVIRTKNRDGLMKFLKDNGISSGVNYPIPLHLQPAYANLGHKKGDFPVTESIVKEILSLPIYPEMSEDQIRYVADMVKEFF